MVDFYPVFNKIRDTILAARQVVVITHQNPDGDAVGSLFGMRHFLELQRVSYRLFCTTPVPPSLSFLPGTEAISTDERTLLDHEYDLIIMLDSGDLRYAGVDGHFRRLKGLPVVINIDHHPTNQHYGHINLVDPQASSTSQIVFRFLDYFRLPIPKDVATYLLTGIMTDTGSFSNLSTTPSSLEAASRLLALGARVRTITANTFQTKPLSQLQLWGRALSRLKQDASTGIVTTVLTREDFAELEMDEDSSEGIANFLNNLDQARAIIVFREKSDGTIKASIRTTRPDIDVSKIAKHFGGGGHKKAAGFTVPGKLEETDSGWKIIEPDKPPPASPATGREAPR